MKDGVTTTDEDRALVAKTADQIKEEVSNFSFDISALKRRVRDDDIGQAFIQAHLYLDHVISRMIAENVPFPRHFQLERASFSQKLQFVGALGLMRPAQLAPIRVVNGIRNKIAHKLEYEVQPSDEAKLRSTLGKGVDHHEDGSKMSLAELLQFLAVVVDVERQQRAFESKMRAQAMANVRVVLDDIHSEKRRERGA